MVNINSFKSIFTELPIDVEENFYKKDFQNKKELLFESILDYISKAYPSLLIYNERRKIDFKYEYDLSINKVLFELNIPNILNINRSISLKENINPKEIYKYLITEKEIFSNYELFMIKSLVTEKLKESNIEKDIEKIQEVINSTFKDLINHEEQSIHFGRYIPMLKDYYKINPKIDFQKYGLYLRIEINGTFITKRMFYNDFYFSFNKDLELFESAFIQEFNKMKLEYHNLILSKIKNKIKKLNKSKIEPEPIYFIEYSDFINTKEIYQLKLWFNTKRLYTNIFIDYQEYLKLRKKLYKYRDSYFTLTMNKEEPFNIERKEMSLFITKEEYRYLHQKTKFKRKKITLKK